MEPPGFTSLKIWPQLWSQFWQYNSLCALIIYRPPSTYLLVSPFSSNTFFLKKRCICSKQSVNSSAYFVWWALHNLCLLLIFLHRYLPTPNTECAITWTFGFDLVWSLVSHLLSLCGTEQSNLWLLFHKDFNEEKMAMNTSDMYWKRTLNPLSLLKSSLSC